MYEVKRLACFASEYENDFIKAMIGRSAKVAENTALRKQRELDALTARDRELDMLFERLYEDNVAGKIDDARFAKMSKRYEQEQGENAKKIKALRLELKKDESKRMDIDDFLETVRRYTDATTITKRMVAELIDYIEVYHAEKQDGVTNQHVVIYYNCIGAFDVPDRRKIPEADIIMEMRKGVALSYAPECRQTPVLYQAKLGFVLKKGKTSDIIQEKRSGYLSLHSHFAYFFRFMAANLSFTQFVT